MFTRITLVLLLLLGATAGLKAQGSFWRQLDQPFGGDVRFFIKAPNGDLYAGGDMATIMRSRDEGATWEALGASEETAGALPVVVTRSGSIFVITDEVGGIFRSSDDGATWTRASGGLSDMRGGFITETGTGALVMATRKGIYRSSDNGALWAPTAVDTVEFRLIALAPGGMLYAASDEDGLYRSLDDGLSWTAIGNMAANPIDAFLFEPSGLATIVGTDNGIFASSDSGATFYPVALAGNQIGPFGLALLPNGDVLAASRDSGLYRVSLSGPVRIETAPATGLFALAVTTGGSIVLGYNGRGILRSSDGGATFRSVGLPHGASIIRIAEGTSGGIYAGARGQGLLRTLDNGVTWSNLGLPDDAFDIAFTSNGTTFAIGTGGGMFRSVDEGQTWTTLGIDSTASGYNVFVTSGDVVLVQTSNGMMRSTDNGSSWDSVSVDQIQSMLTEAPNGDLYLIGIHFSGGSRNLYHSSDAGLTWSSRELTGAADSISANAIFAPSDNVLLLTGYEDDSASVARSTNGGLTWSPIPFPCSDVYSVMKAFGPGHTLLANSACGLYSSDDLGMSWSFVAPLPPIEFSGDLLADSHGTLWYGGYNGVHVGSFTSSVDAELPIASASVDLFPNPSRGAATIALHLAHHAHVTMTLRTLLGQTIATITDRTFDAGDHSIALEQQLPAGSYLLEISAGQSVTSRIVQIVR